MYSDVISPNAHYDVAKCFGGVHLANVLERRLVVKARTNTIALVARTKDERWWPGGREQTMRDGRMRVKEEEDADEEDEDDG